MNLGGGMWVTTNIMVQLTNYSLYQHKHKNWQKHSRGSQKVENLKKNTKEIYPCLGVANTIVFGVQTSGLQNNFGSLLQILNARHSTGVQDKVSTRFVRGCWVKIGCS